jgi:hypothetical protein
VAVVFQIAVEDQQAPGLGGLRRSLGGEGFFDPLPLGFIRHERFSGLGLKKQQQWKDGDR